MEYYIYGFIIILIIILFYLLYFNRSHQDICNDIYNQTSLYTKYSILKNVLTKEECNSIIQESERYGEIYGWTTKRHDDYPTTDNQITKSWKCYPFLKKIIETKIFPNLSKLFQLNQNKLLINEIFIAKYDGDDIKAQHYLDYHVDGCEFSFIITLNDNYTGGGTHLKKKNKYIHLKTGDIVIFCGQTKHAGLPVTHGTRYILPGFIYYGKCKQQEE